MVAVLLLMLLQAVPDIDRPSARCLTSPAGRHNTAYIPQLQATAPVLAKIVDEAIVQDGYMNALTDGYGGVSRMSNDLLVFLSVLLAVVAVAVLALALMEVRRGLRNISTRAWPRSADALETVEAEHLQPARARREGDQRPVRHHPVRAAGHRRQGRDRGREEAVMTLWSIGD